jgi:hypothetical protein
MRLSKHNEEMNTIASTNAVDEIAVENRARASARAIERETRNRERNARRAEIASLCPIALDNFMQTSNTYLLLHASGD